MTQGMPGKMHDQKNRRKDMSTGDTFKNFDAERMVATTFGVFAGIGGLTHGIGEMLQGNVRPSGLMIASWTQGPIAVHMGGDPAMTVVPNATIAWAAAFVQRRHGGAVLILLSVAMLLVGGGVGPPTIGVLAGIAGILIHAQLTWWHTHLSGNARRLLAGLWPWFFGAALISGVFLFLGALILMYVFDWGNELLYLNSFFLTVVFVVLAIITGIAHDLLRREPGFGRVSPPSKQGSNAPSKGALEGPGGT
jgi:hypothetical protein